MRTPSARSLALVCVVSASHALRVPRALVLAHARASHPVMATRITTGKVHGENGARASSADPSYPALSDWRPLA